MTPSKEDYIKLIVELGGNHRIITNKEIADAMDVKAASVTDMNTRLVEEGLIDHVPYKGVRATEKGHALASKLIRKHRIWEVFLYDKLGYSWDEVHAEADQLEHTSSDRLTEALYQFLGEPKSDPHGGSIPDLDGLIDFSSQHLLAELEAGQVFTFIETVDEEGLLKYLDDKKLVLNERYQVLSSNPYDGQITIQTRNQEEISISQEAAQNIYVLTEKN